MIYVTFGTDPHPFDRALDLCDVLPEHDDVVVQHGATPYRADWSRTEWLEFVQYDRQLALMRDAAAVVTHAGVGSIMSALARGVKPVVIARMASYGEHVDDHQLQIAAELGERGLVTSVESRTDLRNALARRDFEAHWVPDRRLRRAIREAVGELA